MGDWFSLSVLQILSLISFVTSVFAVVRVGSASLGRLQHKFEADVPHQTATNVVSSAKVPMWSWKVSGLPVSLSLGSILGEDEQDEGQDSMSGYSAGSTLVRMDWQLSRPASSGMQSLCLCATAVRLRAHTPCLLVAPQPRFSQPPLSMAKLIMTRHVSLALHLFSVRVLNSGISSSNESLAVHCGEHQVLYALLRHYRKLRCYDTPLEHNKHIYHRSLRYSRPIYSHHASHHRTSWTSLISMFLRASSSSFCPRK